MRCKACDIELSDYEATRKTPTEGFLDLCDDCYFPSDNVVPVQNRPDLFKDHSSNYLKPRQQNNEIEDKEEDYDI